MCMISRFDALNIAEEDITVYKVVKIENEKIFAPVYSSFEYKKGEKYHSEDFNNVSVSSYALYISHGFHVFKNEIQAVKSAYGLRKMFKENYTVFVCIIPKGARYYEGMFSSMGMLCAEDLILKQESDIQ